MSDEGQCLSSPTSGNLIKDSRYAFQRRSKAEGAFTRRANLSVREYRWTRARARGVAFDSLRDSRKKFDSGLVAGTHLGPRVGPYMHARTAYRASSCDVTPDYNRRDPPRRAAPRGRRGVKGRVKKTAPMKGEKRSDPNRFTPGQQHARHPRKTHCTSA